AWFAADRSKRAAETTLTRHLQLLLPPPLDRAADADRFTILGHRAPGEVASLFAQQLDQLVVAEDVVGRLGVAERADLRLDRFGRYRALAVALFAGSADSGHAAGEEVFQLERAPVAVQVLVAGDPADGRFVHLDRFGDRAQSQWPQHRDALAKEAVLLLHDFGRHFQDGLLALVERLDQPVRVGELFAEPRLRGLVLATVAQLHVVSPVDDQTG